MRHTLVKLLEPDILGVLPEALTAHVQAVFADQTMSVGAGTAENYKNLRLNHNVRYENFDKIKDYEQVN